MLHFLSPALLGPPDLDPLLHNYAAKAYKWVKDEQDKHTAAGDEKLRERYQRLLRYFHASGIGQPVNEGASVQPRQGMLRDGGANVKPTASPSNLRARWFVRGVLVGIALTLALNFLLTQ